MGLTAFAGATLPTTIVQRICVVGNPKKNPHVNGGKQPRQIVFLGENQITMILQFQHWIHLQRFLL